MAEKCRLITTAFMEMGFTPPLLYSTLTVKEVQVQAWNKWIPRIKILELADSELSHTIILELPFH